jgi:protein TonB
MNKCAWLLLCCSLLISCATPAVAPETAPVVNAAASANCSPPSYPPTSKRLGEQGTVIVKAFVETNDSSSKVEILQSSGYLRLDQAATTTVRCWRYMPGKVSGVPTAMWLNLPVSFRLE